MKKSRKSLKLGSKTLSQRIHFKKRMLQRYNIEVNRHMYRDIIKCIQQKGGEFIERLSNRVSVWLVVVEGRRVPVIYDKVRCTLVTALPKEYLKDEKE